jgi:hypothetical protein
MSKIRFVLVGSLMVAACEDKLAHRTDDAAERAAAAAKHLRQERHELAGEVVEVIRKAGALARAQHDFEQLRALRIASLRAEHSVAASQPLLIQAISNEKTLSPVLRARLEETLAIFRQRLAHTRRAIEQLQYVQAADWERHDDEVGRAMAGMFIARDASWHAIDKDYREDEFPET